jgi:ribosomal-protein-alanine N-acetyltransferase
VGILIADMRPSDLDEVDAVAKHGFEPPWTRDAFQSELARAVSRCRVARTEAGGPVRAYAIWWIVAREQHLLAIATDPGHRRQGLARALFEEMIAEGEAAGVLDAYLEVRPSNDAALALYRSHGFDLLDVRRGYYADGEDAWIMARRLAPAT